MFRVGEVVGRVVSGFIGWGCDVDFEPEDVFPPGALPTRAPLGDGRSTVSWRDRAPSWEGPYDPSPDEPLCTCGGFLGQHGDRAIGLQCRHCSRCQGFTSRRTPAEVAA